MLKLTLRLLLTATILAGLAPAQLFESLVADFGAVEDNSRVIIVQPSQNPIPGTLTFMVDAPVGSLAALLVSAQGKSDATNQTLAIAPTPPLDVLDAFCFSCPSSWLEPASVPELINQILASVPFPGPLTFTPVDLGFLTALTQDQAFYTQLGALDTSTLPTLGVALLNFSGGVTVVRAEPVDAVATGAQPITPVAPQANANRGQALASGDFNGDGVADLAVGHPGENAAGIGRAGRVYLYLGQAGTGLQGPPIILEEPVVTFTGISDPVNAGPHADARFGSALAVGNFDADPAIELAVAASEGGPSETGERPGQVFLFPNLDLMLAGVAPGAVIGPSAWAEGEVVELATANTIPASDQSRFGFALVAGDLDDDGIDDLAVGAPLAEGPLQGPATQEGAVYVYLSQGAPFGPTTMMMPTRTETLAIQDVFVDPDDRFGTSLSITDMDGDQAGELIVGVAGQDASMSMANTGKVVIFDGFGQMPPVANPALTLESATPIASEGLGLSVAAGDFNNDGIADVAAGSEATVGGALSQGRVHVFTLAPGYNVAGPPEIFSSPAPAPLQRFGLALHAADLNRDGVSDLAVGAPGVNFPGALGAGSAVVYFGTSVGTLDDTFRRLVLSAQTPSVIAGFGGAFASGDFATDATLPGALPVKSLVVGEPLGPAPFGAGRVAIFRDLLARNGPLAGTCP